MIYEKDLRNRRIVIKSLEDQKIIQRTVYPENPPKVEYALTELGESISPVLKPLCDWGTNYQAAVSKNLFSV